MNWPTDVETVGAACGLGSVVGVHRLDHERRPLLAADVLYWATLVLAFLLFSLRSGWLGALGAALGAIFALARGSSDAWVESFVVRMCVSLTALAVLVVVGLAIGESVLVVVYLLPGLTAWALSLWHHLYRAHAAWICCTDGMIKTDGNGTSTVRFTWPMVSTVHYTCRLRTMPHAATAEGYAWFATDEFTLTLADGTEHRLHIPSGGPPDLVMHAGPPSPFSTTIAERVSEVQVVAAQARIDAGETVPFGPLTVGGDGLGTTGGLLAWPEIERVRVDQWAMNVVYNPRVEDVFRYLRLFIQVRTEAAEDGRDPRPSRWNVGEVPDVALIRRVHVPEGERLESAELDATDSQIPNLFTLLRLFDAYGKR
ncbi:hypothetical protein [Actinomadura sp. DC4]|uniref:hypothetical protein n=1 Tax=Actinomadura sp. DC4 TaxID=3055069 RepID=UPI0025AEF74C|nr:hypothetical protein [Actinomadura sp. DC4]MDN3352423.1 hypothetical protein [Actinomadura sp. DC4]